MKLTEIQIMSLLDQVHAVILYGLASHDESHDESNDRSDYIDLDLADGVRVFLREKLKKYEF